MFTPKQTRKVFLKHIDLDARLQPRDGLDEALVARLMEAIENGAKLPPVAIFEVNGKNKLAGGRHRYEAHSRLGLKHIEADIYEGTFEDAWLFSRGDNNHGKSLSNDEKKRTVKEMLDKPVYFAWSDRAIAAHIGVGNKFVGTVRRGMESSGVSGTHLNDTRIGRDGKQYPAPPASSDEYEANLNPSISTELEPEEDPFADEVDDDELDFSLPPAEPGTPDEFLHPFADVDSEEESEDSDTSEPEAGNSEITEPEQEQPEPTLEENIRQSPLGLALAMYGHQGYKFVESALMQEDLWKKISAIHSVAGRLRHTSNATADVLAPVARFAHWSKWEGCPACKGSGRFGERKDPCATCKTWGFVIIPDTGVSADVVREFAESLNAQSV